MRAASSAGRGHLCKLLRFSAGQHRSRRGSGHGIRRGTGSRHVRQGEFGRILFRVDPRRRRAYRCEVDLATGRATLLRDDQPLGDPVPTAITKAGSYDLAFANVDGRLTLWVNKELPFGDGEAYDGSSPATDCPNDLKPASIGASGAVSVRALSLWRDTYYTLQGGNALFQGCDPGVQAHRSIGGDTTIW